MTTARVAAVGAVAAVAAVAAWSFGELSGSSVRAQHACNGDDRGLSCRRHGLVRMRPSVSPAAPALETPVSSANPPHRPAARPGSTVTPHAIDCNSKKDMARRPSRDTGVNRAWRREEERHATPAPAPLAPFRQRQADLVACLGFALLCTNNMQRANCLWMSSSCSEGVQQVQQSPRVRESSFPRTRRSGTRQVLDVLGCRY